MYYEESVIDGVLHHRHHPRGVWVPLSPTLMTNKYVASQIVIKELTEQVEQLIRDSHTTTAVSSVIAKELDNTRLNKSINIIKCKLANMVHVDLSIHANYKEYTTLQYAINVLEYQD